MPVGARRAVQVLLLALGGFRGGRGVLEFADFHCDILLLALRDFQQILALLCERGERDRLLVGCGACVTQAVLVGHETGFDRLDVFRVGPPRTNRDLVGLYDIRNVVPALEKIAERARLEQYR